MFLPTGNTVMRVSHQCHEVVAGINLFFTPYESLEELLQAAARFMVERLHAQSCVVTWVAEDRVTMWVRAKYSRGELKRASLERNGADLAAVPESLPVGTNSRQNTGASVRLTAPLRVHQKIVGYVCVATSNGAPPLAQINPELFPPLCESLSRAIEYWQMRQMLASSRLAQAASRAARPETDSLDACILQSVQNPERVARILARSFYKDLRKAGFGVKQIMLVASEMIAHLGEAFHKTKAKTH